MSARIYIWLYEKGEPEDKAVDLLIYLPPLPIALIDSNINN